MRDVNHVEAPQRIFLEPNVKWGWIEPYRCQDCFGVEYIRADIAETFRSRPASEPLEYVLGNGDSVVQYHCKGEIISEMYLGGTDEDGQEIKPWG